MTKFTRGKWALEWDHECEGFSGDYNPRDPLDQRLLRASLTYNDQPTDDGSYCTMANVDTPEAKLKEASDALFDNLPETLDPADFDGDSWRFNDHIMQKWTWYNFT